MDIITINERNIQSEHICCSIGNDKLSQTRSEVKKNWMKDQFRDGLVFKRLDARGKVFIEYIPVERVWKPVIGQNFMAIHCLWVSGQFKGNGYSTQLLDACIQDARAQNMDGVVVVTSTNVKPFLTDRKFYLKHGFVTVDTAPPYFELMALKFNPEASTPKFSENARNGNCPINHGLALVYSNQCPFMEDFVGLYARIAQKYDIPCTTVHLKSCQEAQQFGSPFGTMGIYYQGHFQWHELMAEGKFESCLLELSGR